MKVILHTADGETHTREHDFPDGPPTVLTMEHRDHTKRARIFMLTDAETEGQAHFVECAETPPT